METVPPAPQLTQAKLDEIYGLLLSASAKARPVSQGQPIVFTVVVDWTVTHQLVPLPKSRIPRKLLARVRRGIRRRHHRTTISPGEVLSGCKIDA